MSVYNVLNWQNENTLTHYPFSEELAHAGVIVDANFIQFDSFIPVLNYITVDSDRLTFAITLDFGQLTNAQILKSVYLADDATKVVNLYNADSTRFVGSLSIGIGALELWKNYTGQKLTYNKAFDPSVVKSIPSKDAVYTLDGLYGDVVLSRTTADSTVFYNCVNNAQERYMVFNAVAGHQIDPIQRNGLRKINLVRPLNNNINLAANDVLKFNSINNAALSVALVSGTPTASFTLPTL